VPTPVHRSRWERVKAPQNHYSRWRGLNLILKSRMTRNSHVRFGSGGGVGDCPADHNLGHLSV
jgi:hypothetical protein